ncbi:hypothetical protein PBY51_002520 [Eleginops maclovinus]|uniref:Uncharacterized protein n=1 Tax=Eleginops maclovinus TaxID=56733 RepID=A0AAN7X666_ELEMC|nr:hypothetical protein PBY51_002520 [Eleginops maclovinus]
MPASLLIQSFDPGPLPVLSEGLEGEQRGQQAFDPGLRSSSCTPAERSFSRKPHAPPARLWCGCLMESCCQAISLLSGLAVFLDLHRRSTVSKYWSSHPSTMSREVRKRPTRLSQPNSWSSITVSWSLSYHQVQMEITGLTIRADPLPVESCEWGH